MKQLFTKTTYSILVALAFFGGFYYVNAVGIPLNQAPWSAPWNGSTTRGQQKSGPLTVGSSTPGTSALTVQGTGLRVEGVNCAQPQPPFGVAASTPGSRPCPYSPFTPNSTGVEFRLLGSGNGIGGYMYNLMVGAPVGAMITPSTSLDVVGTITADPAANYLNYATGTLYQNSTTDKQLCARPNGDIVVCGTSTDGACGSANGTTMTPPVTTSTPNLCASGSPVMSQTQVYGVIGWSCLGTAGGLNVSCSATNANQQGGGWTPVGGGNQPATTTPINPGSNQLGG